MKLHEAKELLIKTMRERESVNYVLGWLTNSYLVPQCDETEEYVVVKTLANYGIDVKIEKT